jgi:hypothetical protein
MAIHHEHSEGNTARSKHFCNWFIALQAVGVRCLRVLQDGSGQLDEKELHICLLMLYDKLNDKLPCHVRVPTPEQVHELFERYAPASGGSLSEAQFIEVAQDMLASDKHWYESVFVRAFLTIGLQLALFPLIGTHLCVVPCFFGLISAEACTVMYPTATEFFCSTCHATEITIHVSARLQGLQESQKSRCTFYV